MLIVSRKEAKAAGLRYYFTGRPCIHGHLEMRRVANKKCMGCHRDHAARRRAEQGDNVKAIKARSYKRHKPTVVATVKRWQKNNPAHRQATQSAYRARQRAAREADAHPH